MPNYTAIPVCPVDTLGHPLIAGGSGYPALPVNLTDGAGNIITAFTNIAQGGGSVTVNANGQITASTPAGQSIILQPGSATDLVRIPQGSVQITNGFLGVLSAPSTANAVTIGSNTSLTGTSQRGVFATLTHDATGTTDAVIFQGIQTLTAGSTWARVGGVVMGAITQNSATITKFAAFGTDNQTVTVTNNFIGFDLNDQSGIHAANAYGFHLTNIAGGSSNTAGVHVQQVSGTGTNNYGVFVGAVAGATNNFAILTTSGTHTFVTGAGNPGQAFNITTGAASSGNNNGGDIVVNLGAGLGTSRNGQFQLNATWINGSTNTSDSLGNVGGAALAIGVTNSPASAMTASPQCLNLQMVTTKGANTQGLAVETCEFVHSWQAVGADNYNSNLVYGGEATFALDGAGNISSPVVGWQGNVRGVGAGTLTTAYCQSTGPGPFTGAVTTLVGVNSAAPSETGGGTITNFKGFYSQVLHTNGGGTFTSPLTVYGAHLLVPSQGGNTLGTTANRGLVLDSLSGGAGVGASATGGTVTNYALEVQVPSGSAAAGGTVNNAGIFIQGNGNAAATNSYTIFAGLATAPSILAGGLTVGANLIPNAFGATPVFRLGAGVNIRTDTVTGTLIGTATNQIVGFGTKITTYNNIATAANGIGAIVASGRPAQQVNSTVTIVTYANPASDASYEISVNVNVTASATAAMTVTCTYTDEANVARTLTIPFFLLAGTLVASITTAQGNIAYESVPLTIRVKASTTISIQTASTVTGITYTCEARVVQVA